MVKTRSQKEATRGARFPQIRVYRVASGRPDLDNLPNVFAPGHGPDPTPTVPHPIFHNIFSGLVGPGGRASCRRRSRGPLDPRRAARGIIVRLIKLEEICSRLDVEGFVQAIPGIRDAMRAWAQAHDAQPGVPPIVPGHDIAHVLTDLGVDVPAILEEEADAGTSDEEGDESEEDADWAVGDSSGSEDEGSDVSSSGSSSSSDESESESDESD